MLERASARETATRVALGAVARSFLSELGNPYAAVGVDPEGQASIDWGVYGVPETFVIDRAGRVRLKHVGPLTPQVVRDQIEPLLKTLEGQPPA